MKPRGLLLLALCCTFSCDVRADVNTTKIGVEPPSTKQADKPAASSMRGDIGEFSKELEVLDRKIKQAADKIGMGQSASLTWNEVSARVDAAIKAHQAQSASCLKASSDLKIREENGDPETYLRDGRVHVRECDDAASRYRTALESMRADVQKLRKEVDYVEANTTQLGGQQEEQLQRKKTLEQLIDTTTNGVREKIDKFNKQTVGY